MSRDIFKTDAITATRMVGPVRPASADRTMVQITDNITGQFVQVYPSALQGILVAIEEDNLPTNHTPRDDGEKFRVIARTSVFGGELEARFLISTWASQSPLRFVLCADGPDGPHCEVDLTPQEAMTILKIQGNAEGHG